MVDLSVIQWLDLAGVFVFASSGALVAARKRLIFLVLLSSDLLQL